MKRKTFLTCIDMPLKRQMEVEMKGKSRRTIFLMIQFVLYGMFLTLDILGRNTTLSNYIKFAAIVLCLIYIWTNEHKSSSKQNLYLCYAYVFTVISDLFILLMDYYFYGVLTFIVAQQLYGMRIAALYNREEVIRSTGIFKKASFRLLCQMALSAFVCILLWLAEVGIDPLLAASIFYFISICTNVAGSMKLLTVSRNKKEVLYFTAGMVLFLLCDINVGLFNMSGFLSVGPAYTTIYSVSSILMWTFYAPSQVLIALSGDIYQQNTQ